VSEITNSLFTNCFTRNKVLSDASIWTHDKHFKNVFWQIPIFNKTSKGCWKNVFSRAFVLWRSLVIVLY